MPGDRGADPAWTEIRKLRDPSRFEPWLQIRAFAVATIVGDEVVYCGGAEFCR